MSSVSVVIPCYNYGHFLRDAVDGALDQPGVDVKVLIIDDASTDDSAEVAQKIAANDERIEVAIHPVNKGNLRTYNEGIIDWADSDYTVMISADDRLTPGALRRLATAMSWDPRPWCSMMF
jgi:glycosyltransferase involved in cell wall biosynthesis